MPSMHLRAARRTWPSSAALPHSAFCCGAARQRTQSCVVLYVQADLVATFAPLGSLGCLGPLLMWRDRLPQQPQAQPVADLLTRVAVKQGFQFLTLVRSLVRPVSISSSVPGCRQVCQPGIQLRIITQPERSGRVPHVAHLHLLACALWTAA